MLATRKSRLERLRNVLCSEGADSILVSEPNDVIYLSGFTGEGYLVVTRTDVFLMTDFRYTEQAEKESPDITVVERKLPLDEQLSRILVSGERIALDGDHLVHELFMRISGKLNGNTLVLRSPVRKIRAIKDDEEVSAIAQAIEIAESAFADMVSFVRPGITEKDAADEFEYRLRKKGSSAAPFETIVASGTNSSRPHHTVSDRTIKPGDVVLLDWGARVNGYCSDMTRMLFFSEPSDEHAKVYGAVLEAQESGLKVIRANVNARDVDAAARLRLDEEGYGCFFGHGLGHGVGLDVHEHPVLSQKSEDVLMEGMIVTVEPGVYRPEWGGIRIEDMALVTAEGHRMLTQVPRNLESAIMGG